MWDFTHTCNPTISPSRVSLCLSVGFKTSLWAMNKSYTLPLALWAFHFIMHHPWVSRTPSIGTTCQPRTHIYGNPTHTSMGTPHVYAHGNLAPHHYLVPLAIFLCWAFLFLSFFSKIFMCGPFRLSLSPLGRDHGHITTFVAHHHGL